MLTPCWGAQEQEQGANAPEAALENAQKIDANSRARVTLWNACIKIFNAAFGAGKRASGANIKNFTWDFLKQKRFRSTEKNVV